MGGDQKRNYYNDIYARSIAVAGVTVTITALLFVFLSLRRSFNPWIASWTVLSIFFGTNLYHYATKEMGGVHVYSFCLFASLIYYFPIYLRRPGLVQSLVFGIILGWLVLIRPTNAVVVLFLLGYEVYTWRGLKERILFFLQRIPSLCYMSIAAFLMIFPQLLYWKEMTGKWFYYSYTTEGFTYWKQPKIAAVLFDVQNGLFLYSPMVLLMIAGIFIGIHRNKFSSPVLLLIFSLATYAFASWWAWWFGGAFGHRSYVEYYALFAFPLAGLYQSVFAWGKAWLRFSFLMVTIALMIYSVRLSYLYTSIGGPWDGADWRWNWDKYAWIMSHFF